MANNSLTILTNQFFALVLKSPIQMGWLSIINSVTNISRLGTFKWTNGIVHPPWYLRSRERSVLHNKYFHITLTIHVTFGVLAKNQQQCLNSPRGMQVSWIFNKPPTLYRYWETFFLFKWQKQGSLSRFRPLTGWGLHRFGWKSQRE
jgi:hypothetical protein